MSIKSLTVASLFLSLLVLNPPRARAEDLVKSQNPFDLTLLGRGIRDRKEHRTLALTCTGAVQSDRSRTCEILQWALINDDGSYQLIGETLNLIPELERTESVYSNGDYAVAIQKYLRGISRQAKKDYQKAHHSKAEVIGSLVFFPSVVYMLIFTASLPAIPVIVLLGLSADALAPMIFAPGISFSTPYLIQMNERNGWNWAISPKNVSSKYFELILKHLQ